MAAEIASCPDCGRKLRVPEELLGKLVKCPACGKTFTAEKAEEAAPPEQVPVTEQPPWDPPEEEVPVPRSDSGHRRSESPPDEGEEEDDDYRHGPRRRRRRRRRDYLTPHRGQMILVLGILALFTGLGWILGPMAWIMGNTDMVEMRAGRMDPEGESNTNAGRICGMIATILHIVGVAFCLLYFCVVVGCFGGLISGAGGGPGGPRPR